METELSPASGHDKHNQKIIKLLKDLGSSEPNYPPELLSARRAAFLAQVKQLGAANAGEESAAAEQEVVKRFGTLKSVPVEYPQDLLSARRAAFLAQVKQLGAANAGEESAAAEQEVVKLLGTLRSVPVEYPPHLLTARRAAFLSQIARAGGAISFLDQFRSFIQGIFQKTTTPVPSPGFMRVSLLLASLMLAVIVTSFLFSRVEQSFQPSPSQAVVEPTYLLPTSTREVSITICKPEDPMPSCAPGELDPSRDLADPGNGAARPAVSKDARSNQDGVNRAAYVNDGRGGASWVSNSADSWIKIDLGQVTNINTVSLQKGKPASSNEENPGQFVIAVALSDVYADGDSSNDLREYAPVFYSEQAGFNGRVSHTETIKTQFPAVKARFVKITFENAGAAIEEVGVFMIESPVLDEQSTSTSQEDLPGITLTVTSTDTPSPIETAAAVPTGTALPTRTAVSVSTNTPIPSNTPTPLPTNTQRPTDTATPLPTKTRPPTDTSTPVPIAPLPSNTPLPSPTVQPSPVSTDPIIVTASGQTLTFICNGNDAEIRGHANTVTLLGSCRSITLTGNGNYVFWQFGSPIISNKGNDNIIIQL